jgi:hypothetical protein
LARLWNLILGKGIAQSLGRDLAALAKAAEADAADPADARRAATEVV